MQQVLEQREQEEQEARLRPILTSGIQFGMGRRNQLRMHVTRDVLNILRMDRSPEARQEREMKQRDDKLLKEGKPQICQFMHGCDSNLTETYYDWYCLTAGKFLNRNTYSFGETDEIVSLKESGPKCECHLTPVHAYRQSRAAAEKYLSTSYYTVNLFQGPYKNVRNLFTDITLKVSNDKYVEEFVGHKAILAHVSPMLKELFTSWSEGNTETCQLSYDPRYFALWFQSIYGHDNEDQQFMTSYQQLRYMEVQKYLGIDNEGMLFCFRFESTYEKEVEQTNEFLKALDDQEDKIVRETVPIKLFKLYLRLMLESAGQACYALIFERCENLLIPPEFSADEFPYTPELRLWAQYHKDRSNALVQWLQ